MKPERRENILQEIAEAKQQIAHLRKKQEEAEITLQLLNERLSSTTRQKPTIQRIFQPIPFLRLPIYRQKTKLSFFAYSFEAERMCIQNCGRTIKRLRKAIRLPAQTNGFGECVKNPE